MINWKPRHLLASWVAWWIVLIVWGLGPAIPAINRISKESVKSDASVNFGGGVFHAVINEAGKPAWQASVSVTRLCLLFAIPPLVLWALWLWAQRRRPDPALLGDPAEPIETTPESESESLRDRR
jgi:hypothetical protein